MKISFLKLTLAALLIGGMSVVAQAKPEKSTDQMFVRKAAIGGMTEVKLGEIASKQGSSSEVKDFGSMMVTDHTKLNDSLKAAAEKKGYKVPAELDAKHQATVDKLSKLSGEEFDKAYLDEMVKDHEKDYAEFQEAAKTLDDPDLKAVAESGVPVIKSHLDHVKKLTATK